MAGGRGTALLVVLALGIGTTVGWMLGAAGAPPAAAPGPGSPAAPSARDPESPSRSPASPGGGATAEPRSLAGGAGALGSLDPAPDELPFLAEALRRERERRAASRISPTDSGLRILAAHRAGADVDRFLGSFEAVAGRIRVEGRTVSIAAPADGSPVSLKELSGDAAVIELGPGRFVLAHDEFSHIRVGIRSLEIRGAGMDATTLVSSEGANEVLHVWKDAALENLVVRDLTVEGGPRGGGLLDVRGEASARIERVRFRGWAEAGHSAPLAVTGAAFLLAKDCEFLGEGRRVTALSCRGPALALLENCLFSHLDVAVRASHLGIPPSHVHIQGGTFEGARLAGRPPEGPPGSLPHLRVQGATVRFGGPELDAAGRAEAWGAAHASEVEAVTYAPLPPRLSLDGVLGALARLDLRPGEFLTFVGPSREVEPTGPVLHVRLSDREAKDARVLDLPARAGADPREVRFQGGAWRLPEGIPLDGLLPFSEAARKAGIPGQTSLDRAGLGGLGSGEQGRAVWYVMGEKGWPEWTLDARTGEVLRTGTSR